MAINKIRYQGVDYNIDIDNKYSTEEQVIGTWINDKPIYRKVVVFKNTFSANTWYDLSTNVDFKEIIKADLSFKFANIWKPIPCAHTSADWESYIGDMKNGTIAVRFGGAFTGNNAVTEVKFIIEYTKTID